MSFTDRVVVPDRAVIEITGADAVSFLDNLATNTLDDLPVGDVRFAALLSPQGKILAEFFAWRTPDGFRLDTRAADAASLIKRLTLYKLRAKVSIADLSDRMAVIVAPTTTDTLRPDPRDPRLGARGLVPATTAASSPTDVAAYHAHRIALGVPDGGLDYPIGDAYPHEANHDRLHGVSFTKGCFVGQEVVARMQNKTVVRKRIVRVDGDADLVAGTPITLGEAEIGRIGSVAQRHGLALLRLDRALEARTSGQSLTAGVTTLRVDPTALDAFAAATAAAAARDTI